MHITIAVCTRNRPHLLRRCLHSLQPQLTDQDELLVVDNASTTIKTKIVAREMSAGYIYVQRPGLDVARNTAVNIATGDIIAFIDDDAIAADNWIAAIRLAFANESVVCVTGRTMPLSLETAAQRHFEFRFSFDRGDQPQRFMQRDDRPWFPIHPYHLGSGCNMAFRRLVFDDIGLFDEALDAGTRTGGGGDLDIFRRLLVGGYQAAYVPDALIYHEHRKESSANRRQFWGYGKTFGALMTKISSDPSIKKASAEFSTAAVWYAAPIGLEAIVGKA